MKTSTLVRSSMKSSCAQYASIVGENFVRRSESTTGQRWKKLQVNELRSDERGLSRRTDGEKKSAIECAKKIVDSFDEVVNYYSYESTCGARCGELSPSHNTALLVRRWYRRICPKCRSPGKTK